MCLWCPRLNLNTESTWYGPYVIHEFMNVLLLVLKRPRLCRDTNTFRVTKYITK